MEDISIINAQDIPALVDLINQSYRNDIEGAWTTEAHLFVENDQRITADDIKQTIDDPKNHIFKYVLDGALLGTVTLTEKADNLYLGTFAVNPKKQGLGIGKKLVLFSKKFAQQKAKKNILISVISVRDELIAWYERLGFIKTGKLIPFPTHETQNKPLGDLFFEEMICPI